MMQSSADIQRFVEKTHIMQISWALKTELSSDAKD